MTARYGMDPQTPDQGSTDERLLEHYHRLMRAVGADPADYDEVYIGYPKDGVEYGPRILFIPPTRFPEGHPLREEALSRIREVVERADEDGDPDGGS